MSNRVQFFLRSGDDFGRTFTWTTSNQSSPVDLTNAKIEFSIRGGSVNLQYIDDEHAGIIDAESGTFFIYLNAIETRFLRQSGRSSFLFEVTVEFSETQRRTVVFGTLIVSSEAVA